MEIYYDYIAHIRIQPTTEYVSYFHSIIALSFFFPLPLSISVRSATAPECLQLVLQDAAQPGRLGDSSAERTCQRGGNAPKPESQPQRHGLIIWRQGKF